MPKVICEYCGGPAIEGDLKCQHCGAPLATLSDALPDFRFCPLCHRKLIALGSPACNYCGRRLPDAYIKAREADLKRIEELSYSESEDVGPIEGIFPGDRKRKSGSSLLSFGDLSNLFDL